MPSWSVQSLVAEDREHRVIKDEYGVPVVDVRAALGDRIHSYRVRWRIFEGTGAPRWHSRRFPRNARGLAEDLYRRLKAAEADGSWFDAEGLPAARAWRSTAQDVTFESAVEEYIAEHVPTLTSTKNREHVVTNLHFAVATLRHTHRSELHYQFENRGEVGASLRCAELDREVCVALLRARRETNIREWRSYHRDLDRYLRFLDSSERSNRPGPKPSEVPLPIEPEGFVTVRTEQAFSTVMTAFFKWLEAKSYVDQNLWSSVTSLVRNELDTMISGWMVPTLEQAWDLADAVGSLPGGARYRVPVLGAYEWAPRTEEWYAIQDDWLDVDAEVPSLNVRWAEVHVSRRWSQTNSRVERRPLKHRPEGDSRVVPISEHLLPEVIEHLSRFGGAERFVHSDEGNPIRDRKRWADQYFKPAVKKVFGESDNQYLRQMTPRWLRKGGINWWLSETVSVDEAARRAGHSGATLLRYYAAASQQNDVAFRGKLRRPSNQRRRLTLVS